MQWHEHNAEKQGYNPQEGDLVHTQPQLGNSTEEWDWNLNVERADHEVCDLLEGGQYFIQDKPGGIDGHACNDVENIEDQPEEAGQWQPSTSDIVRHTFESSDEIVFELLKFSRHNVDHL